MYTKTMYINLSDILAIREGLKKKEIWKIPLRVRPPPPTFSGNDFYCLKMIMKQILYDTGLRVVARWPRERVSKLRNSVLVKRPPPPKNGKK